MAGTMRSFYGPVMLPESLQEEVKSEVDIFFLDAGSDPVTDDANSGTRGGRQPDETTKRIWDNVCAYLDSGIEVARAKIIPTIIIDWQFFDEGAPPHLNLTKDEALFERGWVFQVEGFDTRLMIHGHTFFKWSERTGKHVQNRADDLTSVNYRIAVRDNASRWSQDRNGTPYVPVNCDVPWQQHYRGNRAQAVWKWREWRDDEAGFPRADLVQGRSLDAFITLKYKRMQNLLRLAAEAHYEETYSKHETNKKIRCHGQLQTIGEMDITRIRKKTCRFCWKIECVCHDLGNDAAKSSQNMEPEAFVKVDGSPLDRPDDAPWPFTILFVGVDNGEKTDPDLNLKNEFEKIEQAYRESKVYHGSSRVLVKQLFFSKWSEVLIEIRKEAPTMLQFGCHSQKGKGLELFRQIVDPNDVRRYQKLEQICPRTKSATAGNPHYCVQCLRF
jgi:hypothetical protein